MTTSLQSPKLSAAEGQRIASVTIMTLEVLRNENNFKLFWQKINHLWLSYDIEEAKLPRKRISLMIVKHTSVQCIMSPF